MQKAVEVDAQAIHLKRRARETRLLDVFVSA